MNFSEMAVFENETLLNEHAEALLINKAYDRNYEKSILSPAGVIAESISEVESELANPLSLMSRRQPELHVPYANQFGFEVAKRAAAWLKYRTISIDGIADAAIEYGDLRPYDARRPDFRLEPRFESMEDMLASLRRENDIFREFLRDGNVLFGMFFNKLETARRRLHDGDDQFAEPLIEEQYFAYHGLLRTFDAILDGPLAITLGGDSIYMTDPRSVDLKDSGLSLHRHIGAHAATYGIRLLCRATVIDAPEFAAHYSPPSQFSVIDSGQHGKIFDNIPANLTGNPLGTTRALLINDALSPQPIKHYPMP